MFQPRIGHRRRRWVLQSGPSGRRSSQTRVSPGAIQPILKIKGHGTKYRIIRDFFCSVYNGEFVTKDVGIFCN